MKKYLIDPYVISILFQTKNDDETLIHYQEVMDKMFQLIVETIRYYLEQKNIDKSKIDYIIDIINSPESKDLDSESQKLLREDELIKLMTESVDSLGKIIYDNLLPILPVEDRKELHRYLEAAEPIVKYNALAAVADLIDMDTKQIQEIDLKSLAQVNTQNNQELPVNLVNKVEEVGKGIVEKDIEPLANNMQGEVGQPITDDISQPIVAPIEDQTQNKDTLDSTGLVNTDVGSQSTPVPSNLAESNLNQDNPINVVDQGLNTEKPLDLGSNEPANETSSNDLSGSNSLPNEQIATNTLTPTDSPSGGDVPIVANNETTDTSQSIGSVTPEIQAQEDPTTSNQTTAVDQLQSMGIDLNDALSQPPQS